MRYLILLLLGACVTHNYGDPYFPSHEFFSGDSPAGASASPSGGGVGTTGDPDDPDDPDDSDDPDDPADDPSTGRGNRSGHADGTNPGGQSHNSGTDNPGRGGRK